MSLAATNWAWGTTLKHPSEKLVLLALADCHNGRTKACFPSSSYLRKMTGLSNGSVFWALESLKKKGFIGVVKRIGHSSEYVLALNNLSSNWRGVLQPLERGSPITGDITGIEPEINSPLPPIGGMGGAASSSLSKSELRPPAGKERPLREFSGRRNGHARSAPVPRKPNTSDPEDLY